MPLSRQCGVYRGNSKKKLRELEIKIGPWAQTEANCRSETGNELLVALYTRLLGSYNSIFFVQE